jgi:hypothetical protein
MIFYLAIANLIDTLRCLRQALERTRLMPLTSSMIGLPCRLIRLGYALESQALLVAHNSYLHSPVEITILQAALREDFGT